MPSADNPVPEPTDTAKGNDKPSQHYPAAVAETKLVEASCDG